MARNILAAAARAAPACLSTPIANSWCQGPNHRKTACANLRAAAWIHKPEERRLGEDDKVNMLENYERGKFALTSHPSRASKPEVWTRYLSAWYGEPTCPIPCGVHDIAVVGPLVKA